MVSLFTNLLPLGIVSTLYILSGKTYVPFSSTMRTDTTMTVNNALTTYVRSFRLLRVGGSFAQRSNHVERKWVVFPFAIALVHCLQGFLLLYERIPRGAFIRPYNLARGLTSVLYDKSSFSFERFENSIEIKCVSKAYYSNSCHQMFYTDLGNVCQTQAAANFHKQKISGVF